MDMIPKLLTRDEFRTKTFQRDQYRCINCGCNAILDKDGEPTNLDAHHIVERRLWGDGGYYLENGATVCEPCHIMAEQTVLSCDDIREKCKITKILIPFQFYDDDKVDKWGNYVLPNGTRMPGELFYDESVQKILEPVLHLFTKYVKYGRTYHLPWSPGVMKDDRVIDTLKEFENKNVVVTVKMDGENTTMYNDYIHARSISYEPHPSRSRVKALHGQIAHDIPNGWRVCGENVYAKHSIHYKNLEDYFLIFSVWNDKSICLSWEETKEWAALLGLKMVPVLYEGKWDEKLIKGLYKETFNGDECEGYVVRIADSFPYSKFKRVMAKYVRKNHVQTHGHWMRQQVEPNGVKNE
jgi:hypothetical protein